MSTLTVIAHNVPFVLNVNDTVLDLKYQIAKKLDRDILYVNLTRESIDLKNSDKILPTDTITVDRKKSRFSTADFEYLDIQYKFRYPVQKFKIKLKTIRPRDMFRFSFSLKLESKTEIEAFKIVDIDATEFLFDSSVSYNKLTEMIGDYVIEQKLAENKSLVEVSQIFVELPNVFDEDESPYSFSYDSNPFYHRYFTPDEKDLPLINLLDPSNTLYIEIFIHVEGFIRINYSVDATDKFFTFIRNSHKILDLIDNSPGIKDITGTDRQRVVVYKGVTTHILDHNRLISDCLANNDIVRYVVLPSITFVEPYDIKGLSERRDSLFDLRIVLYNKSQPNYCGVNVLATLFLLNAELSEENIFTLWFKNKGKFSDAKEIKINVSDPPFDTFSIDENKFALEFVVDYIYRDLDKYNYIEILNNLPCVRSWSHYFGLVKLFEVFNHKDAIEYSMNRAN
ncbi:MAG: hypothetical protein Hyperionvirus2_103 [Hyperionvirus sp.]|uniref:Uncharacterized protein n=1 Tax=Hyperionvirus sp. TaxID=2487770 RepID=A0A3G5A658_9VIRU|nr:MAG: hypothetical protein Hyperionvirus2_103 [Hyperionvirus sp.]